MKNESIKLSCLMEPLSNNDSSHVFFATLGLIAFTLILEFISHERVDCCKTISDMDDHGGTTHNGTRTEALMRAVVEEQPQPRQTPAATTSQPSAEQGPNVAPKKTNPPVGTCCLPDASPNVRANRLITAIFLYAVIVTLFVIRIRDATIPHLRRECARYTSLHQAKPKMSETNWWIVVLLNIIPFVCASLGFLRTFVDCVLVRWGQGLGYGNERKGNIRPWPPCLPFLVLWAVPITAIKVVLVAPIAWLMGRSLSSAHTRGIPKMEAWKSDDVEMQGEETMGLVDHVDGDDAGEEDQEQSAGPPAYDEAVHGRETHVRGRSKIWTGRSS